MYGKNQADGDWSDGTDDPEEFEEDFSELALFENVGARAGFNDLEDGKAGFAVFSEHLVC